MKQPIHGKSPREDRRFDQTQCRNKHYGRLLHRDYMAHFFRWQWATKLVEKNKTKILDVGCGQDLPLPRLLCGTLNNWPKLYVGVDLNRIPDQFNVAWSHIYDEFNFVKNGEKIKTQYGRFDLIVCFEVIEHMGKADGRRLLKQMYNLLSPKGQVLLSTPIFSGTAARNHLHEYTVSELLKEVTCAEFKVLKRWGTFGNVKKIFKVLTDPEVTVWEALEKYYSNEALSVMFAPGHPDVCKNNLWVLSK